MLRRGEGREAMHLVEECSAFLEGRLAHYLEARGHDVPAWAWTNLLAHGVLPDVQRVCRSLGRRRNGYLSNGDWQNAQSYLAGEVLERAGNRSDALRLLQMRALVPLELRLAAAGHQSRMNPAQLVSTVLNTLAQDAKQCRCRSERPHVASQPDASF